MFLNMLGRACLFQGDLEQATALSEEAAALTREGVHRGRLEEPLHTLGWVALLGGDLERAKALHKESLALCHELGDMAFASNRLAGLACVAGAEGEVLRAARLFGAAEASCEETGIPLEPAERTLVEPYLVGARSQLEEGTWTKAWEEGQAMSMEEAIEYALSEVKHSTTPPSPAPKQPSAGTRAATFTHRQEEIAALVARGLSNRQIASELSISEHTVATHLRRMLKKLGLRSRAELAAWVSEQQPSSSDLD